MQGFFKIKHVIEAASGRAYAELINEKIFAPLGMKSSSAAGSNGTGGIVTTLRDLANYAVMLIDGGDYSGRIVLSPRMYERMLDRYVELPECEYDYHYSLAWEVMSEKGMARSFYKAGRWFGEASGLQVYTGKKIAFIYLCNPPYHLSGSFMKWRQQLTSRLRKCIDEVAGEELSLCRMTSAGGDVLRAYEGRYRSGASGRIITISRAGGNLYSDLKDTPEPLALFSSNRFLMGKGQVLHNFVWRDSRVIGLSLSSGFYMSLK